MREIWGRMGWRSRFFAFSIASSLVLVIYAKLGGLDGFAPPSAARPFDRQECLLRQRREKLEGQNPDEMSDDEIALVARACAIEETEHRYSN